jgi:Leucine-rich repeat (LRR) protein
MEVLDLSRNMISGYLSQFYNNIPKLKYLNLSSNLFKGQLEGIMNLPNIEIVELQNNLFEGIIPPFSNKNLKVLDLRNNTLTGNFPVLYL